jgi:hypothetical protein
VINLFIQFRLRLEIYSFSSDYDWNTCKMFHFECLKQLDLNILKGLSVLHISIRLKSIIFIFNIGYLSITFPLIHCIERIRNISFTWFNNLDGTWFWPVNRAFNRSSAKNRVLRVHQNGSSFLHSFLLLRLIVGRVLSYGRSKDITTSWEGELYISVGGK